MPRKSKTGELERLLKLAQSFQLKRRTVELPTIVPVERNWKLKLSFAQQRLWFLARMESVNETYHIATGLRLSGKLDWAALRRALNRVVARHEPLRTVFLEIDGEPIQRILPAEASSFHLMEHDLSGFGNAKEELDCLVIEEAREAFDLEAGPLIRGRLIRESENEHALLITMHHIVSDGWSLTVMFNELSLLYSAFLRGDPDPLPKLDVQYADYAAWQRQWIEGEVLERQAEYWKANLNGAPTLLQVPQDHDRPVEKDYEGAFTALELDAKLTAGLKALSRRHGATLYMTLLAAWGALLSRLSDQQDVVVGTPVANRGRTEIEGLIGFFVNMLALRLNFTGLPTVSELLERVKTQALMAQQNQDIPFEQVVEILSPIRSLSHSPIFQVMFAWQSEEGRRLELPGLAIHPLPAAPCAVAKFDLTLSLREAGELIVGGVEYATSLFERSTIERYLEYLRRLLEGMVADETQPINRLPILPEAERDHLLRQWNSTEVEYPREKCVHELFEEQVEKSTESVAVVFEDEQLSYGELNRHANRLAHYLRELGIGPEVRVGLCVERSLHMVVGLLGILKAGAAYVPLDPDYPDDRLGYMLQDSECAVVLTHRRLARRFSATMARIVELDTEWAEIAERSPENLSSIATSKHAAYLIYTSGSTGRPKGTVVPHEGLLNVLLCVQKVLHLRERDVVATLASFAFDISLLELITPLLVGGTSLVFSKAVILDPQVLLNRLDRVTVLHAVPSLMRQLVDAARSDESMGTWDRLRGLLVGGDLVSPQLVEGMRTAFPNCEVFIFYGPTEASIVCACREVAKDNKLQKRSCSIGRPLANTQVYVLDKEMEPVPIGVAGELNIGGDGLARGYVNRPDLTADRFVPNPFSASGGMRLYRTGDVARWRANGTLEYLGRVDEQVKIRGYRIELGEVETILKEHEGIQEAVVVAQEVQPEHKKLVAYIVGRGGRAPGGIELRRYLQVRLPEYMIPAAYIELGLIPLTANGKLDRKALSAANASRTPLETSYVSPRTAIEQALCEIWRCTLKLERVGVEDNFFELGGDSILSIQIVSRARAAGIQLSVEQMFRYQTIAELSAHLGIDEQSHRLELRKAETQGTAPLTPIQQRFFEQEPAEPWSLNQRVLLSLPGQVKPETIEAALQQLIAHHDGLQTRFVRQEDGNWRQEHSTSKQAIPIMERVDLRSVPQGSHEALLQAEATRLQRSLNLERGVLLRAGWFDLPEGEHRLFIVVHHLAIDGVSWRILLEDLQTLYEHAESGRPMRLPAKSSSFCLWAAALKEYAGSELLRDELPYWEATSACRAHRLRRDELETGENGLDSNPSVHIQLSADETRALLREVPRSHRTQIQEVLIAALVRIIQRWNQHSGVLLDIEGHGREELPIKIDVSRTVGWFTTVYPIFLELRGEDPEQDLEATREKLRGVPGRGLGYGVLRYLHPEGRERLGGVSGAEISFNYLGQFDQVLRNEGWKEAPEPAGAVGTAAEPGPYLFKLNSSVSGGRLRLTWEYSQAAHRRTTVQSLASAYLAELRALLAHLRATANALKLA